MIFDFNSSTKLGNWGYNQAKPQFTSELWPKKSSNVKMEINPEDLYQHERGQRPYIV